MLTSNKSVPLQIGIPIALDSALDQLVRLSGTSKASIVRTAIAQHLLSVGVLAPVAADIPPTPTRGPGLASDKRKATQ